MQQGVHVPVRLIFSMVNPRACFTSLGPQNYCTLPVHDVHADPGNQGGTYLCTYIQVVIGNQK
jgi:hypothetical protein